LFALFVVTNAADAGSGSLRATITAANQATGADVIHFDIPDGGQPGTLSIALLSPLPDVTDVLTIDGYTQPGARANTLAVGTDAVLRVELRGDAAGTSADNGLVLRAPFCAVRGLVINRFSNAAVAIAGGSGTVVVGNYLGTDAQGVAALGNQVGVLCLTGGVRVGDIDPAARNVISGNLYGVECFGAAASGNQILNNYVGLNAAGTAAVTPASPGDAGGGGPVPDAGIYFLDASSNIAGGPAAGEGNVIAGQRCGVLIQSSDGTSAGNLVQGNLIGTDAVGVTAVGNSEYGVEVREFGETRDNVIGVAQPGAGGGNFISGSGADGVLVSAGTSTTRIEGNSIGVGPAGTALGNAGAGVRVSGGAGNTVADNVIRSNGGAGVVIEAPAASPAGGNQLRRNSIDGNGGLGIDLGGDGATANDPLDADGGANGLQNAPALASARVGGGDGAVTVRGSLHAKAATVYRVEFFASPAADPSGFGEGRTYLGARQLTSDENGDVAIDVLLTGDAAAAAAAGQVVTATAEDTATRETSEFSNAVRAAGPPAVVGRHVFYNRSAFDGNDAGANADDDAAVATDKAALLPGGTATFANYTSYARGLNGIMVDIESPAAVAMLGESDFAFRVGNGNDTAVWAAAPAPAGVAVRPGAGVGGTDRITIVWADNAVGRQWLQVTVLATANTGLVSSDVFYFGNATGESGNNAADALVNFADEHAARARPHGPANPAPLDCRWDYNRDRRVDSRDAMIARASRTSPDTAIKLITVPAAAGAVTGRRVRSSPRVWKPSHPLEPRVWPSAGSTRAAALVASHRRDDSGG
jgi:hypothetical protein